MADTIQVDLEAVTLDEDPVSFLASIKEECPDILSILTTKQVKLLSRSPLEPYSEGKVDEEFMADTRRYLLSRTQLKMCSLYFGNYLLRPKDGTETYSTKDREAIERKKNVIRKV